MLCRAQQRALRGSQLCCLQPIDSFSVESKSRLQRHLPALSEFELSMIERAQAQALGTGGFAVVVPDERSRQHCYKIATVNGKPLLALDANAIVSHGKDYVYALNVRA